MDGSRLVQRQIEEDDGEQRPARREWVRFTTPDQRHHAEQRRAAQQRGRLIPRRQVAFPRDVEEAGGVVSVGMSADVDDRLRREARSRQPCNHDQQACWSARGFPRPRRARDRGTAPRARASRARRRSHLSRRPRHRGARPRSAAPCSSTSSAGCARHSGRAAARGRRDDRGPAGASPPKRQCPQARSGPQPWRTAGGSYAPEAVRRTGGPRRAAVVGRGRGSASGTPTF